MTTTTDKLAEALRFIDIELSQHADRYATNNPVSYSLERARAALAAYEAEQPRSGRDMQEVSRACRHTPEPWHADDGMVDMAHQRATLPDDWRAVATGAHPDDSDAVIALAHPDNARRIVACVNACAGIPTAALENAWRVVATYEEGDALRTFTTGNDNGDPSPVKVVVAIGGGCLRSVHADAPLDVTLYDFDDQEGDVEEEEWKEASYEAAIAGMEDYS